MKEVLGEMVMALCKARGIKQNQLAEILAISQGQVSKIQSGRYEIRFSDAIKLCNLMGIELDCFRYNAFIGVEIDSRNQSLLPGKYLKDADIFINTYRDIFTVNAFLFRVLKIDKGSFYFSNLKVNELFIADLCTALREKINFCEIPPTAKEIDKESAIRKSQAVLSSLGVYQTTDAVLYGNVLVVDMKRKEFFNSLKYREIDVLNSITTFKIASEVGVNILDSNSHDDKFTVHIQCS